MFETWILVTSVSETLRIANASFPSVFHLTSRPSDTDERIDCEDGDREDEEN